MRSISSNRKNVAEKNCIKAKGRLRFFGTQAAVGGEAHTGLLCAVASPLLFPLSYLFFSRPPSLVFIFLCFFQLFHPVVPFVVPGNPASHISTGLMLYIQRPCFFNCFNRIVRFMYPEYVYANYIQQFQKCNAFPVCPENPVPVKLNVPGKYNECHIYTGPITIRLAWPGCPKALRKYNMIYF
jgi:hypothetical protein